MANAGMAVRTTVTKTIVKIMIRDIKGEIEEKIS